MKSALLVLVGLCVGLLANALGNHDGIKELPAKLGWTVVIFPVTLGVLFFDYYADYSARRAESTVEQDMLRSTSRKLTEHIETTLATLIQFSSHAVIFPRRTGPLNIHLYLAEDFEGRVVLRKRRAWGYNFETFPTGHTLDYADPAVDGLIICQAYNEDAVVYGPVSPSHTYNSRINNRIDRRIGWVMGIPIHRIDQPPLGVICAFGTKPPFTTDDAKLIFEQAMVDLASVLGLILTMPESVADVQSLS